MIAEAQKIPRKYP